MRGYATLHRESSSTATNRATLLFSLTEVFQPVVMLLLCLYGKACLIVGYRRLWSQILACLQPRFRTTSLKSFTCHERGAFSEWGSDILYNIHRFSSLATKRDVSQAQSLAVEVLCFPPPQWGVMLFMVFQMIFLPCLLLDTQVERSLPYGRSSQPQPPP
jgi:hypothetical protein